ncbi:DUF6087 family protein [Streptomyces lanatus]|uniref:DUF6087 family protein n=1 Tax=Streptomyces lanatus TaxID=66900 RepID=A0ABV1XXQ3_9ACTN
MGPEDEPLEEWAARRDRRRAAERQITGTRRAVPLAPSDDRAAPGDRPQPEVGPVRSAAPSPVGPRLGADPMAVSCRPPGPRAERARGGEVGPSGW